MKCPCCQTGSQDLYCAACLNQGLENHAQAHHILHTQLSASRARSEKILHGNPTPTHSTLTRTLSPPLSRFGTTSGFPLRPPAPTGLWAERSIRAQIHRLKQVNEELITEITRSRVRRAELRKEMDEKKKQVRRRRANLEDLRGGAGEGPSSSSSASYHPRKKVQRDVQEAAPITQILTKIDEQRHEDAQTTSALRRARKVLVTELVTIYGIRPRKPDRLVHVTGDHILEDEGERIKGIGHKGRKRTIEDSEVEMEIAGLWLPTPKHFTGHTSNHLNGTITHLLHFLHLISIYLDIKVPFGWSYGGSESSSSAGTGNVPAKSMSSSTIILPPTPLAAPPPPPLQRPGFQVYPLPSPGSSGSGWQVGKPVVSIDDSLAFGRFVKLSAEREMASRDEGVFEEDDNGEGSEEDQVGEEMNSKDDGDGSEPEWVRTEDLNSWRKKSSSTN